MNAKGRYLGPERRNEQRRQHDDRRDAVRWEPAKADRRKSYGRRKDDRTWRLSD